MSNVSPLETFVKSIHGNTGKRINRLKGIQQHKLNEYVLANYASAKLPDPQFAEVASKALGFSVTKGNVEGSRQVFEIPSSLEAKQAEKGTVLERLDAAEKMIGKLMRVMQKHFPDDHI